MKIPFIIICSLVILVACSKSDKVKDNNSETDKMLQGSWIITADHVTFYNSVNKVVEDEDINLNVGSICKFDKGIISVFRYNDTVKSTYEIINQNKFIINDAAVIKQADITVLTDTTLKLSVTDTSEYSFGTPPVYSNHNITDISFKKFVDL